MGQQQGAGAAGAFGYGDMLGANGQYNPNWAAGPQGPQPSRAGERSLMQEMMARGGQWSPVGPAPGAPVPQAPQTPAPQPGGTPQSLGLGLGLNAGQRAAWQQAAQSGQGAQWLGEHERIAQRVQNRVEAGSPQEARLQRFIGTGQSQAPYRQTQQDLLQQTMRRR